MPDLSDWAGQFAAIIDTLDRDVEDWGNAVLAFDQQQPGGEALVVYRLDGDPDEVNDIVLEQPRQVIGMAVKVNWSPTPTGKSSPAWTITMVARAHPLLGAQPAVFATRRIVEDKRWTLVDNAEIPWFLASTASGLRHLLDEGKRLEFKRAEGGSDPRLFDAVRRSNPPRLDEKGRL